MSNFTKVINQNEYTTIRQYLLLTHNAVQIEVLDMCVGMGIINRTPLLRIAAKNFADNYPIKHMPKILRKVC